MGKALTTLASLLFLLTAASGCNTSGCTDNQSSLPLAVFYTIEEEDDTTIVSAISLSTLQVSGIGAPNDSILYESGSSYSQIYLPFRSSSDQTSYCFHYTDEGLDDDAYNDTITFAYTSQLYFASEECGVMWRYNITSMSHTTHLIDSVAIIDSLVTNSDDERIQIYFRTN